MSENAAMAQLLADDTTDLGQLPRAQVLATLAVAEELAQLTKFLRSGKLMVDTDRP